MWNGQLHQYQSENQKDSEVVFLLARFRVMFSCGEDVQNPNATGWFEKTVINLEADILPASGCTGKSRTLAWYYNLHGFDAKSRLQFGIIWNCY